MNDGLTDKQLSKITGYPVAKVIQILNELEQMGLVEIEITHREELVLTDDTKSTLENNTEEEALSKLFPERAILKELVNEWKSRKSI